MEENLAGVSEGLETSLCSSPIFPPFGHNIENISSISEASDLNNIEISVYNNIPNEVQDYIESGRIANFVEENRPVNNYQLPLQVKETLKANADLLTDKKILDHFLNPEHIKKNPVLNLQSKFNLYHSMDNAANKKQTKEEIPVTEVEKDHFPIPYLSDSSTPQKPTNLPVSKTNKKEKHVNFVTEEPTENLYKTLSTANYDHPANKQSFSYFGSEIVLGRLGEIRKHLDLKDEEEKTKMNDLPLSHFLSSKLNSQKQRTKDLEEELALNEASLTKLTFNLEVVQNRLLRREQQLKDAEGQIEKLQTDWKSYQQKLISSRDFYHHQFEHMKKVAETLRNEKESAERELKALREEQKEFSDLKVRAEGMKYQVEKSSRQNDEVIQENERLNKELKSLEEKFNHYGKELPKLKEEKSRLEIENEKLHSKLDNFLMAREDAEEELKSLKNRHALVLDKALEDKELKEAAIRERDRTLELVEGVKREQSLIIDELSKQYHNQLESFLLARYSKLEEEFEVKEKELRESFDMEILELKKSFEKQKNELKNRHLEDRERVKSVYERKEQLRESEIIELKHENEKLQNQIRTVAMAISAPEPRSAGVTFKSFPSHDYHPPEAAVHRRNEYNGNPVKKLKDNNSEASSSDKENKPIRQSSHQKRITAGPLLASTSLSSVHESADERKEDHRERNKAGKDRWEKLKYSSKSFGGKKLQTAAQILGSIDSLTSSEKSSGSKFFKLVDKEVSEIVQEINSMSELVAPAQCANETPRHDTSVEQDSARLTLQRINQMSDMLSKYVS